MIYSKVYYQFPPILIKPNHYLPENRLTKYLSVDEAYVPSLSTMETCEEQPSMARTAQECRVMSRPESTVPSVVVVESETGPIWIKASQL